MKLGILGGTFNPVHLGHLLIANTIREYFHLDKVLFVPAYRPPHKEYHPDISDEARYKMLLAAIEDNPNFEASDIEFKRKGKSYTIDTIDFFYSQYSIEDKIHLIIGADLIFDFYIWKKADELAKKVILVLHDRDQHRATDLVNQYQSRYPSLVTAENMINIDIHSTIIRKRLQKGLSIKYMVPKMVEEIIMQNRYYH